MVIPEPEENKLGNACASSSASAPVPRPTKGKRGKEKGRGKVAPAPVAGGQAKGEAVKLLQTMSIWLAGTDCPQADDSKLTGWSERYAEQFDREPETESVDLAPVLGLPEGTAREELTRVAEEQEEDLLKQLIGSNS